ncbi:MAG: hydrogenase formation protein HypD [Candidatus Acetothermia bacterium]|nr:hydrogenase formation protein HypD [Candidatus Acetothermia bacterium]MDH7505665.1 hydrogenase formation protein HypD [Candidatus Acetothermia bacterium]
MKDLRFRDRAKAEELARLIARLAPEEPVKLVHVCGTHEVTITEFGLRSLLPPQVEILEGPGCPVCVTPVKHIDEAVALAEQGHIVATFGDMARVPGTHQSLEDARSAGADVRIVYSVADAVELARKTDREVVFFAVGFETTAPTVAAAMLDGVPENFSLLVSHKLIPPAMAALVQGEHDISGFLAPGHVSTIIGMEPYKIFPERFGVPVVIGGFEPLDILYSIALLLRQLRKGEPKVENAYTRAVRPEGNLKAQAILAEVFEVTDHYWRGMGPIPGSGLKLREEFAAHDARERFGLEVESNEALHPGCRCAQVITAKARPDQCPLFQKACTPRTPYGPCMVGEEGMCHIWARYGGRPKL